MLVSKKIKEAIIKEVKTQETLLKQLENQEKNYEVDYSEKKAEIQASIDYYKNIIKKSA